MNTLCNSLIHKTAPAVVFLALAASSTAQAEYSLRPPSYLSMEQEVDAVVSTWPESADAFDRTWEPIAALLEAVRKEYAERVKGYHPLDAIKPEKIRTPQSLARRSGRVIPRSGIPPMFGVGTPSPPPANVTQLSRHPRYYGIHCLTPVPGKPELCTDILMLNYDAHRVHAARFDERNVLRELTLIAWVGASWRALEFSLYPDGTPQQLRFWQNGAPAILRCDWTPKGERKIVSVRDGQYEGEAPVSVCSVSVSFLPPGLPDDGSALDRSPFPMPVAALHLLPTGVLASIEAPLISVYDLAGWSGEGSGASAQLPVQPQGPLHLVAHYAWNSHVNQPGFYLTSEIADAIKRLQGAPVVRKSSYDLLDVTDLDISTSRIDDLETLLHFRRLQRVDLSKTPVNDLFPLSQYSAIERAFSGSTSPTQSDLFNRVLLALNSGIAPPIDTLILQNTDLSEVYGLVYLQSLKHLDVRKSKLTDFWFAGYLDSLESLDAAQNDIFSAGPLEFIGPRLRSINLERNQLTDLAPMAQRSVWPTGMEIALSGNNLNPDSLCTVIPALKTAGVSVTFDGSCETQSARISDEDADGDGYTNREEWQFVSLFSALEPEREARFAAALKDPATPRDYLSNLPESASGKRIPIDNIPTASVELVIQGKGSVYPGTGVQKFADKIFNSDGTWAWNEIVFRPAPAPGWQLSPINEHFFDGELFRKEETGSGIVMSMRTSAALKFEFEEIKATMDVDLVDALKQFVEKYYPDQDPFTFDANDINLRDGLEYPAPNGIPDAAELRLIQAILQTPGYNEYGNLGTSYAEAMEIWTANLPIAQRTLGEAGLAEPFLVHLLTGYSTMGGFPERGAFLAMIRDLKGLHIDRNQFEQGIWDKLRPDESIHRNATSNKNIWKQISDGRKIDRKVIEAYAAAVLAQPSR